MHDAIVVQVRGKLDDDRQMKTYTPVYYQYKDAHTRAKNFCAFIEAHKNLDLVRRALTDTFWEEKKLQIHGEAVVEYITNFEFKSAKSGKVNGFAHRLHPRDFSADPHTSNTWGEFIHYRMDDQQTVEVIKKIEMPPCYGLAHAKNQCIINLFDQINERVKNLEHTREQG